MITNEEFDSFRKAMNPGDVACCPLVSNVGTWDEVKDKHHDWELSECPECGAEIWLSTIAVALIRDGGRYACTKCALQGVAGGTAEDLKRIQKEHGHEQEDKDAARAAGQ